MTAAAADPAGSITTEFSLIREIQGRFGRSDSSIVRGIGDDAAVLSPSDRSDWVVTTDLLAEGIHFDLRTASWEDLGYRAAAANLSDIAAMGGLPKYFLVSLALPSRYAGRHVYRLYAGMMTACRPHRVRLIGGDTSASRQGVFINLTVIGTVRRGRALLRHGARIGDGIYVTGTLGDSQAGLALLQRPRSAPGLKPRMRTFLIGRHLRPTARVREGLWLSANRFATAAIDVSDGVSGDLRHICEESRVGADVEAASLPVSPACRAYANCRDLDLLEMVLRGGEDYELLFTVPASRERRLRKAARTAGIRVTRIGTIVSRAHGATIRTPEGSSRPLPVTSYEHFRSGTR